MGITKENYYYGIKEQLIRRYWSIYVRTRKLRSEQAEV